MREIPSFGLYGGSETPAGLHCETIGARAPAHGWRIAPHRHAGLHQVFLFLSGAVRVSVDGRWHELALPALAYVPPFVVHGFAFAAGTEGHVLTLPAAMVPELLEGGRAAAAGLDRWGLGTPPPGMAALFATVEAEMGAADLAGAAVLRGLALQILGLTARAVAAGHGGFGPDRAHRHMARFEAQIRAHLPDRWSVARHAAALGLTATHLTRITRAVAGVAPGRLIEVRRLQEARRLLAYTEASVAEVGYALGFDDPAYFNRVFRRAGGESPGAFRRRATETGAPETATPETAAAEGASPTPPPD